MTAIPLQDGDVLLVGGLDHPYGGALAGIGPMYRPTRLQERCRYRLKLRPRSPCPGKQAPRHSPPPP